MANPPPQEVSPSSGPKATPLPPKVGPTREAPPPTKGCMSPLTWIIQRCESFKMPSPAKPQSQEQKPGTAVSRRLDQVVKAGKSAYYYSRPVLLVLTMGIRPGASGAAGLPVF